MASGLGALVPTVQAFVRGKNLEHYRKLLAGVLDPAHRELVLKLLAEEEAKSSKPEMGKPED